MERKERRHHTREFKLEAVRLAGMGDKTKAQVARELGIRVNQLRQWRLEFEEAERNGTIRREFATAEHDVDKLRKENARFREEIQIIKKSGHLLREGIGVKYAFIEAQRNDHCVRTLCKAFRVSASGYYAARNRPPRARTQRQSALVLKIREAHVASRQSYGAPRVHAELAAQGGRNTVAKLMRREQIVPRAISVEHADRQQEAHPR